MGFEKPGFSGECYVLEKGLYADPDDWGAFNFKMSSIQPVFYVRANLKQEDGCFVHIFSQCNVVKHFCSLFYRTRWREQSRTRYKISFKG